jgi:hypothetical protein
MDQRSEHIVWWTLITLSIGYFIYDIFYKLLLVDVNIDNDLISVNYYSIVFRREELKIEIKDFIDIKSTRLGQIEIIIEGKNGPIRKSFFNNSSPWNDLNEKLKKLKTIANKK